MTYIPDREGLSEPKQLAQEELTNSATSIYSPGTDEEVEITAIYISNRDGKDRWFNMWHDEDGTTYDDTTALFVEVDIPGDSTLVIEDPIYLNNAAGNLAMEAEANNDMTVTIYGKVTDVS